MSKETMSWDNVTGVLDPDAKAILDEIYPPVGGPLFLTEVSAVHGGAKSMLRIVPTVGDDEVVGVHVKAPDSTWGIGQDYAEGNFLVLENESSALMTANIPVDVAITATTNATPVQVTSAAHGLSTGDIISIRSTGIAALDDRFWQVTVINSTTLTLDGSTAPGSTSATGRVFGNRSPALVRIDSVAGSFGTAGNFHLAPGLRGRAGVQFSSYEGVALNVNPYVDVIGVLISSPPDGAVPIPTADYIRLVDTQAASAVVFAVNAAGQAIHAGGSLGAPGISFVGDTDTGIASVAANIISFVVAGAQEMNISTDLITIIDGTNVAFSVTTGTKIGTGASQKFAFHNSTPVIQRSGSSQALVATTAASLTAWGYTQAQANGIVTLLNEVRNVLVEKGLMKGSA